MNKENISKGKVILQINVSDIDIYVGEISVGSFWNRFPGIAKSQIKKFASKKENKANAELIAEAFSVFNETGKTPKELVEEIKELKKIIK